MNKTKISVIFLTVLLATQMSPSWTFAQTYLPPGQVSPWPGSAVTCPSGFAGTSCYSTNIVNCPNAADIPLVYGFLSGTPPIYGTIVMFSGSGGSNPDTDGENAFITGNNGNNYLSAGYNVIQTAWGGYVGQTFMPMPWEDTTNNCGNPCPYYNIAHNIQAAACRPATFLWQVYTTYHSSGGVCAQGFSGGAGAIGYALAWYGAGDSTNGYLDKVELLSGPVFSDIEQGCEVPRVPGPTVCGGNPGFCDPGMQNQPTWATAPIAYTDQPVQAMQVFTGDYTCAGSSTTSTTSNNNWLAMSIVNSSTPSYNYPHTAVTGFACGSTTGDDMNNSSTQAWLFFQQIINHVRYLLPL
jgi:hypothetical protein